ncbi:DUF917 domain-containing protein [Nonomuraea lactucae]|uniref:DUF917 domain-containing protein n=1 Tax=Nonomuraea lactucae TaxID=2249762 RepID=UPI000DE44922|nr:DUF917 domain-containing protein [Nonomuraea lactucae]
MSASRPGAPTLRDQIDEEAVRDIATGAAVLGGGGGGDPHRGMMATLAAVRRHGPVPLRSIDDFDDDDLIATPALVGAPMVNLEKFPSGREAVAGLRHLEKISGRPIAGVFSAEIGGVNSMLPIGVAAMTGLPVVDADGIGRAVPEIDMTLFTLNGLSSTPMVMSDDYGNLVTVDSDDPRRVEAIFRPLSTFFGGMAASVLLPGGGRVEVLRSALVRGAYTLAHRYGRGIREAGGDVEKVIEVVRSVGDGRELFRGRITDFDHEIRAGWSQARVTITGTGPYARSTMGIDVVNENLMAEVDGEIVSVMPDITSVFDARSGLPITTEHVRFGFPVVVTSTPADPRWYTPEGLDLMGPRRFGYSFAHA